MGFRMMTGSRLVVFIFFLGSCHLRKFLLETKDAITAEYGAEYTDSYDVNDYHDFKKDAKSGYKACYQKCNKIKTKGFIDCKQLCEGIKEPIQPSLTDLKDVLVLMNWRTQEEVLDMPPDDCRKTVIFELTSSLRFDRSKLQ